MYDTVIDELSNALLAFTGFDSGCISFASAMGCDEATYLAAAIIVAEIYYRVVNVVPSAEHFIAAKNAVFSVFFVLSMLSTVLFVWRFHSWSIFKTRPPKSVCLFST